MATMFLSSMYKPYIKPSMGGQVILRSPHNLAPKDPAIKKKLDDIKDNFAKAVKGKRIASACKGKKGRAFYGCLRTEGRRAFGKV